MKKSIALSQKRAVSNRSEPMEIRICEYCSERFGVPISSKQTYCNPKREKRLAHERKKALVWALAGMYWRRGDRAVDMHAVAERCIHSEPQAVMKAFVAMGYIYDEKAQRWCWKSKSVV